MNGWRVPMALVLALVGGVAVAQVPPEGPMPPSLEAGAGAGGPAVEAPPVNAGPAMEGGDPPAVPRAARDPFWPVGYVPRPVVKAVVGSSTPGSGASAASSAPAAVARPPDWDEARRHLEIKGVSRIGRDKTSGRESYFADVNGRIAEDGDTVSVTWDGRVYRWRIAQISPTGLQLVKLDCHAE